LKVNKLIPLNRLPYAVRKIESLARKLAGSSQKAYETAQYEITLAAGCYSGPDAPRIGWLMTKIAAEALTNIRCDMPDGTSHKRLTWKLHTGPFNG
jgi:hypothetical protein